MRSDDGGGGTTVVWSPVASVWGAVVTLRGAETFQAERLAPRITHRIRIRHRSGLTAAMRLRDGARIFNIRMLADPDDRERWLDCLCEEEQAGT